MHIYFKLHSKNLSRLLLFFIEGNFVKKDVILAMARIEFSVVGYRHLGR